MKEEWQAGRRGAGRRLQARCRVGAAAQRGMPTGPCCACAARPQIIDDVKSADQWDKEAGLVAR